MAFGSAKIRASASIARYLFSLDFVRELLVHKSRLSVGTYKRHNGDRLPYFFSRVADLNDLLVDGVPLEESVQFSRVAETLAGDAPVEAGIKHKGREASRTMTLVAERLAGRDQFVLCLTRDREGRLNIEDGATRAALLLQTGEEEAPAVVTPWK